MRSFRNVHGKRILTAHVSMNRPMLWAHVSQISARKFRGDRIHPTKMSIQSINNLDLEANKKTVDEISSTVLLLATVMVELPLKHVNRFRPRCGDRPLCVHWNAKSYHAVDHARPA